MKKWYLQGWYVAMLVVEVLMSERRVWCGRVSVCVSVVECMSECVMFGSVTQCVD